MAALPLEGVRVVEIGGGVGSAFCARLMADQGAEVVKVEPPGRGDPLRRWGPWPRGKPSVEWGGLFAFLNTDKRSMTLDLDAAPERARLDALLDRSDLLVEGLPPARVQAWGLAPERLAQRHPHLVTISVTPFGRSGPYAGWRGADLHAYHLAGAGHRYCGRPGEPPLEHGTFSAEFFAGYAGAAWGLAVLYGCLRDGSRGQHVDVSAAEVVAALFVGCQNVGGYVQDGRFEARSGVGMPLGAPATILPCRDGYVWMIALEPGQWHGLRRAMGDPEWARSELFDDMFARAQNADFLYAMIEEWTRRHTKLEIMERCQAEGCPTTALFTVAEAFEHPHLRERGALRELDDPALGRLPMLAAPVRWPGEAVAPRAPAPRLGEHDRELEAWLARGSADPERRERRAEPRPPLAGVRVANFGWGWLGPVAGQTLAWLGADVVKIESRARLDINRTLPPFAEGVRDPNRSLQNHAAWAGNGSVTLNLKRSEGRALALELVARSDIVIENFGPGVMERLGLGLDALRAVRPDVIVISLSAAGRTGPLAGLRTYGMSLSSITGLDSLTGYAGGPPVPVENAFADPLGGIVGAYAAVLALFRRDRRGAGGGRVDASQQEAVMQLVAPAWMRVVLEGADPGPIGNRHPLDAAAPHGVFPCAGEDAWISIAVFDESEWKGLVRALGEPEWARRPELASLPGRLERIDELQARIAEWTRRHEKRALAERLQAHGVPAAPVSSVADLLEDPHFRARGTFVEVEHPLGFRETIYGAYVKLSATPPRIEPGPVLGRDNERVLRRELGLAPERYRELAAKEVIH